MIDDSKYFIVIILSLQIIYNCILSVIGQYIYGYFVKTYPGIPSGNGTNLSLFTIGDLRLNEETCTANSTANPNNSAQAWAQQRSVDLIFQTTLWRAFPVIIITYLFGLYASYLNRRLICSYRSWETPCMWSSIKQSLIRI